MVAFRNEYGALQAMWFPIFGHVRSRPRDAQCNPVLDRWPEIHELDALLIELTRSQIDNRLI
jgi:hypothetical protein